jgi:hypothetical protein
MADLSSYINIAANTVTTANLSATGSVTSNSVLSTTGNVTGNYIFGDGSQLTNITVSGSSPVSTTGNVSAGNLTTTGTVSATNIGNIASINLDGNASTVLYGNGVFAAVAGGGTYGDSNVNTLLAAWGSNTISTTGNITSGYLFGNGSQLTGLPATYGNSNVATFLASFGSNAISTSGNITAGYVAGNGSALTSLTGANVTGTVANATYATSAGSATTATSATTAATVTTNAQPNITSVGTLSSISSTGNITGGNLTLANGQINVTYTPSSITGVAITAQGANTNGGTGYFEFLKATNQSGGATNPNKSFRINSTGGFEIVNSAYTSTIFSLADNGNTVIAGNLNVQGTLTYVSTTNLNVSNALIILANAATTPAQANGGGLQLNGANANIIYGSGNDAWNINKPLVVTGAVSASTTVSAAGNITGGNVLTAGAVSAVGNITGSYIIGNGSQLTGVTAYTNANVAAYLPTYSGNITAGNISVSGNITGGNVLTGGIVSSTGNITGGNISATNHTGTTVSVTGTVTAASVAGGVITGTSTSVSGNVTGGNVLTGGVISATATITGGNLATGGTASATGNITGGNILSSGLISTTGNATHGNVLTGGLISATGNITSGNISATNHTGTTASVSGNITGGNIATAGQASATGNITTANSFVGNLVGTTASMTGTVYAGNVVVNGQPTTYGVVNPAYAYVYLNTSTSYTGSAFDMVFDTIGTSSGITYNTGTGLFSLTAGVTYEFETNIYVQFEGSTGYISNYQWVDSSNNPLSPTQGQAIPVTSAYNDSGVASQSLIYTPSQNMSVKVRWVGVYGGRMLIQNIKTWAKVKQLNPTIAVQATATGTITPTYNQQYLATSYIGINGGSSTAPAATLFTVNIPSAGTWQITAVIRVFNGPGSFALYQGGTLVANTEVLVSQTLPTNSQVTATGDWIVTTTGATTYTVGGYGGTSSSQVYSDLTGRSSVTYQQLNSTFALNALATMSLTGNLTTSGNVLASGYVSATGNVTANTFVGSGSGLTGVAQQTTGSWTVTTGTNTYSITVPINGNYQIWVRGNIPNGIITYQATVAVTNTNVPVLGTQRAWNYTGGGSPILITSIPGQIVGTEGTISTAVVATTTANRFDFVINNTSGSSQTVYWGYVTL